MVKNNPPIIIDTNFQGLATTPSRIPANMLSDMENMRINSAGGGVSRLPGTRVLDEDDTIGFLELFTMNISGVEIAFGIDYQKLRLYGFVASRPEMRLPIRTTSVLREFKDNNGTITNQLAFNGGTTFKCVFAKGKYYIWSAFTSEVIIVRAGGVMKIAESLEPNTQTTLYNMEASPGKKAIYVDAYSLNRMDKPEVYFSVIEDYFPVIPKLAMIAEYGEGGTVGVLSDIVYDESTIPLGGVFSPFPVVSGVEVRKSKLTNLVGGINTHGYIFPNNGIGLGLTFSTSWATANLFDGEIPTAYLYKKYYQTVNNTNPLPFAPVVEQLYLLIPFAVAAAPIPGVTSLASATLDDHPLKIKTKILPNSPNNYVASVTVKEDAGREEWIWLSVAEADTVLGIAGVAIDFHVYKVVTPGTLDRPFPDKHHADLAYDIAVDLGLVPVANSYDLDHATYIPVSLDVHVINEVAHTGSVPVSGLVLEDSFPLTRRCVGIIEDRFRDYLTFIPSGGLLSASSLAASLILHETQEFSPPGPSADFYIDDTDAQVTDFIENGYRMALSLYSEGIQKVTKRAFTFHHTGGASVYDIHGLPVVNRVSPRQFYGQNGVIVSYKPPFISTKYINLTGKAIPNQNDLPIGIANSSDIAIVGPYAYATSNNSVLRGDSETLTMVSAFDLGRPIRHLAALADKVIVFFDSGCTAIAIDQQTGAMYEKRINNGELISAIRVIESGGSVMVINTDGAIYMVSPYTEETMQADAIRIKNVTSGIMDESEFIQVVATTQRGSLFYVATPNRVFTYDVLLGAWSGIYNVEPGVKIHAITTLGDDLVVYTLGNDVLPSDIYNSGGA